MRRGTRQRRCQNRNGVQIVTDGLKSPARMNRRKPDPAREALSSMVANRRITCLAVAAALVLCLGGCSTSGTEADNGQSQGADSVNLADVNDTLMDDDAETKSDEEATDAGTENTEAPTVDQAENESNATEQAAPASAPSASADALRAALDITEDYRSSFVHGEKPASCQKYIVLHDTEGNGSASGVVDYWDGNGRGVAAHFIVNKDGSIVQCVPMDKITHHAGYGDTGHNEKYGVEDESRDDKVGTTSIGSWASDYGMNSYSIGIEMVHVGGSGNYPEAQLQALDNLIAYIDAYYGFDSTIIDHKAWRTGNSDTSKEFAAYLANYQDHRTHD